MGLCLGGEARVYDSSMPTYDGFSRQQKSAEEVDPTQLSRGGLGSTRGSMFCPLPFQPKSLRLTFVFRDKTFSPMNLNPPPVDSYEI